jgi:hypothetical protein
MFAGEKSTAKVKQIGVLKEDVDAVMDWIDKIMQKPPRRSGAGPTGARYEHLKPLAENPLGMKLLKRMCVDFLLGKLPRRMQACLATTKIVALLKPNQKIRPLGLGHVIRRVATKALAKVFTKRVVAVVGDIQMGLGQQAGAERMHKAAVVALHKRPDCGALSLDQISAFAKNR